MPETAMVGEKKPIILVVDDTPENLVYMTELLKENYEIKAATSGQNALTIFDRFQVDLILLDIVMPDMDGYEVCRQIKAEKRVDKCRSFFSLPKRECRIRSLVSQPGPLILSVSDKCSISP
ncbi:hypothetical protein CS022_06235 [Veronia nyctiphanis]|uniref:Response regulatory domain-containing protein n=1 Tax=Veronia nyctiphanis TaxID=1278244 RepID=A0A4Q0YT63_9GAMM|nr:response regulator [Veronia nyctiphanis]RXJ73893.1 hypothetical protein CS022_06235 [Veronia nyctiphanis]